ncbi:MAG: O-antigen ligase family protein [Alphaproteobacteria bacterium]|nr:O-antigen ligase family protein [Alphaproteobacteria bacterium]
MHAFSREWWLGIVTGTLLIVTFVGPRTTTAIMLIVLLAALAERVVRPSLSRRPEFTNSLVLSIAAFAAWALVSAIWSPAPWNSLLKPVFLMLAATGVCFAIRSVSVASKAEAHYLGEGALTALIIGYLLVAIEILSDQIITRTILTAFPDLYANIQKHVTVAADGTVERVTVANLNRRMAFLVWLFWPMTLLLLNDPSKIRRWVAIAALGFGASVIIIFGSHQSSQIALAGGIVVFGIAWLSQRATRVAIVGMWCAAVLLAVPMALLIFQTDLHKADWLFKSARHRVVIWGTAAEEVMTSPLIGVGADATKKAMKKSAPERRRNRHKKRDLGQFESGYANHAHNVYLQVWYELGALGALLFLAIGLMALRIISGLTESLRPAALAMFATTSLLIAFSYSIWQTWFISAFGLSLVIFAIAARKRHFRIADEASNQGRSA